MSIFGRVILWSVLYYAINTFALFYIDAKGVMEGLDGFLFIIPLFMIACST